MSFVFSFLQLFLLIAIILAVISIVAIRLTKPSQADLARLLSKRENEQFIDSWVCNACLRDAEMNALTGLIFKAMDADLAVEATTSFIKKMTGGLWVGGRLILTDKRVIFTANAMNRAVHKTLPQIALSLTDLAPVATRFGIMTKIIDLPTQGGVLSVRLYNAAKIADLIERTRQRAAEGSGVTEEVKQAGPRALRAMS